MSFINIKNKTILVTGATGAVGPTLVHNLIKEGANLVLVGRSIKRIREVFFKREYNEKIIDVIEMNLNFEKDISKVILYLNEKKIKIDGFIHCAMDRPGQANLENSHESLMGSLTTNAYGALLLIEKLIKYMVSTGGGSFIYVGSIYGKVAPDFSIYSDTTMGTEPDYAFIKHGMVGVVKYYASLYGKNKLRANIIVLGGVRNEQPTIFVNRYIAKVPLARMARATDLVGACIYLLSEASSYVTGTELVVDGGFTA